jgi:OOP family OmpA-OmpF porin
MTNRFPSIVALLIVVLSACSTTMPLTIDQLREQYPSLAQLEKGLDDAKARGKDLLAPESYKIALDAYVRGYSAAQDHQQDLARQTAQEGLAALKKALDAATNSEEILSEVLEARSRARKAGADTFYAAQMGKLDEELAKIGRLIDNRDIEKAKERRPELQKAYLDLELEALKQSTIAAAQTAIANAIASEAAKYAPKTLNNAQEELTTAQSVLEVDRTNRDKANAYAHRAVVLANRSAHIVKIIKDIRSRDYTGEDIVLAYQDELGKIAQAMDQDLFFDKSNEDTLKALRNQISSLVEETSSSKRQALEMEAQIAQLKSQYEQQISLLKTQQAQQLADLKTQYTGELSMMGKTQEHLARMHEEQQARFTRIQALFTNKEANVYRQNNNVLISVHGFKFPVGSAEIRPENFALMKKIIRAIGEFKTAKIVVSGHTDATGSADINKMLSENRATNVAKFFTEVGSIDAKRITAEGFGQEKPVASNLTAEGRALNRRVEILIKNNER